MEHYERYREGVIKRHIANNGRLLQEVMLDESKQVVSVGGKVVGGADNPFLYGGLLMSTLSLEAIEKVSEHSFDYATKIFNYILLAEKNAYEGYGGFFGTYFKRTKNWWRDYKILSKDELSGMILGVHYYIKASQRLGNTDQEWEALEFLRRLATYFETTYYLPTGSFFFNFPYASIFQYHLGEKFKPKPFSKIMFSLILLGIPFTYGFAVRFGFKRNFFNVAVLLHCYMMLIETNRDSWLTKKCLSFMYNYFSKGDGKGNSYLDITSVLSGNKNKSDVCLDKITKPDDIWTDDLPIVELEHTDKHNFTPSNRIGECFTWEHSNTVGHYLKYWWSRALWRIGPEKIEDLGPGKYYVESCGLGLLYIRMLMAYYCLADSPRLENDERFEVIPFDGAL